jgi:hypothetical protein
MNCPELVRLKCIAPLLALVCLFAAKLANASPTDFELTLRAYPPQIKAGDPVYFEVTLVNRGMEAVVAEPLSMLTGTLGLRIYDNETRLSMSIGETGGAWGSEPVRYEPNQPQRFYCHIFLPSLRGFDHPFWEPIGQKGRTVSIGASYVIGKRLSLRSNGIELRIDAREEAEMKAIEHWAKTKFPHPGKGPMPNDLGISLASGLSRAQTAEFAAKLQSGELFDLLQVALHLRDIYDTPADSRVAKNKGLMEWLKTLPDIKRQCLIQELRGLTESYRLNSTAELIEQLIDDK